MNRKLMITELVERFKLFSPSGDVLGYLDRLLKMNDEDLERKYKEMGEPTQEIKDRVNNILNKH